MEQIQLPSAWIVTLLEEEELLVMDHANRESENRKHICFDLNLKKVSSNRKR